jgi:Uma2 family endonuclease
MNWRVDISRCRGRLPDVEFGAYETWREKMKWSEVIGMKELEDLPFKIELNEWGNIVMSPASNRHSFFQGAIENLLNQQKPNGAVFPECSIETAKGVKVADVVWGSTAFFQKHRLATPYRVAPELCVEILSPSNVAGEMMEKKDLYLAKGAREFWICDNEGAMRFFGNAGETFESSLFPAFPQKLDWESFL